MSGVLVRALSLLSAPLLTALLSPAAYGSAAYVQTLSAIGAVLGLAGIDMAYARFYVLAEGANSADVERFCWRFGLINAAIVSLILFASWRPFVVPRYQVAPELDWFLVVSVGLPVVVSLSQTRARMAGFYRRIAMASAASGLSSTLVTLLVAYVWWRDARALLIGTIAGSLANAVLLGVPTPKALFAKVSLPSSTKKEIVLLGLAGAVTAPMYWLIGSADRWFLGHFRNESEVGIYAVAAGLASTGLMLNSAIVQTWFPEAMKTHQQTPETAPAQLGLLWERLIVLLAITWLGVAWAGVDALRLLAHANYHAGWVVIPWIAGGVFFYGASSLCVTGLFIANRMRAAAWCWLVGGALSLALNYFLIAPYGMLGAAIAQCCTYGAITVGVGARSWWLYPLHVRWGRLLAVLGALAALGAVGSRAWHASPLLSLGIKFPLGVLAAWTTLVVIAPEWSRALIARARSLVGRR